MQDLITELEKAIRVKMIAELTPPSGDPGLNCENLIALLLIYGSLRSRFIQYTLGLPQVHAPTAQLPSSANYLAALRNRVAKGGVERVSHSLSPHKETKGKACVTTDTSGAPEHLQSCLGIDSADYQWTSTFIILRT